MIRPARSALIVGVTALMALAGCETPGTDASGAAPAAASAGGGTGTGLVANAKPVSPARAKALLDAVCGASLPDFAKAPQLLAANGFTRPSPTGTATIYSQTENASFQIKDGPGFGKTCSMVVASTASAAEVHLAVMGTKGGGRPTSGAIDVAPYHRTVIVFNGADRIEGLTYSGFGVWSERR